MPGSAKYIALIGFSKRQIYLGTFSAEIDAALAYDAAAMRLHGEFARLNFPDHVSPFHVAES